MAAWWLVAALAVPPLAGCAKQSDCQRHCKRVALCKREAQAELILGEKPPPADADCMHKCKAHPEAFARCEASKRSCETLRDCYGSFRP